MCAPFHMPTGASNVSNVLAPNPTQRLTCVQICLCTILPITIPTFLGICLHSKGATKRLWISSLHVHWRRSLSERSNAALLRRRQVLDTPRLRTNGLSNVLSYLDTRYLVPASNICERCFFFSGYTLSNRRKVISQSKIESELSFFNRDVWG